jgi:ribonuclease D
MKNYLSLKEIPNIYCTKIASRFCRTYTDSHGLRTLIMELLGVEIKKDQQCSNWGADELTEAQKFYAKNDVVYLHEIREIFNKMMEKNNRKEIIYRYFNFINTVTDADIMGFTDDMLNHGYVQK